MVNVSRRQLLAGVLAAAALPAGRVRAADESQLRKYVRAAEMVAFSTFKPVDDFTYRDIRTGKPVNIRTGFVRRVVLVNLWATWCPPCVREMGALQGLHNEFRDKGFAVVGINILDRASPADIRAWADGRGLTFPILKGGKWDDMPLMSQRRVPQTFLIDRDGRLIATRAGEFAWADESVKDLVRYMVEDA
jgi:thiol-disulfide isomerase/thioredoxin